MSFMNKVKEEEVVVKEQTKKASRVASSKATVKNYLWMPEEVYSAAIKALQDQGTNIGAIMNKKSLHFSSTKVGQVGMTEDIMKMIQDELHRNHVGVDAFNNTYAMIDLYNTPIEEVTIEWFDRHYETIRRAFAKRIGTRAWKNSIRYDASWEKESLITWGMTLLHYTIKGVVLEEEDNFISNNTLDLMKLEEFSNVSHLFGRIAHVTCSRHAEIYRGDARLQGVASIYSCTKIEEYCADFAAPESTPREWFITPVTQYLMHHMGDREQVQEMFDHLHKARDAKRERFYCMMEEHLSEVYEIGGVLTYAEIKVVTELLKKAKWVTLEELPEEVAEEIADRKVIINIGFTFQRCQEMIHTLGTEYNWLTPEWLVELIDQLDNEGVANGFDSDEFSRFTHTKLLRIQKIYNEIERSLVEELDDQCGSQE